VSDMPEYDCRLCGACCVQLGPNDGNSYVYLDRQEAHRMRALGLPVLQGALGSLCLAARPHDGAAGRPACVAFEGELGARCGCSIYGDRPSICQEFEVGGQLCRQARAQAGLPV
jgi:Fe-S-cluster containining protein